MVMRRILQRKSSGQTALSMGGTYFDTVLKQAESRLLRGGRGDPAPVLVPANEEIIRPAHSFEPWLSNLRARRRSHAYVAA
jgi:hypothetical protein